MMENFQLFEDKMRGESLSDAAVNAFRRNYEQLVQNVSGLVPEKDIKPVSRLSKLVDMKDPKDDVKSLLQQTAVLKLNGGLGTSMGLEKAKSLLEVKDGKTFLDLIAEQVVYMRKQYDCDIQFILMNSFSTSEDTLALLKKNHPELAADPDLEMMQNKSPKIDMETLKPASYSEQPDLEWCPPGHGDIYPSLLGSGTLDKLLAKGVKYLFVSNSDNLGATLDLKLLSYFANSKNAFVAEVCERTEGDKKGGHLCQRKSDGKLMLRESAMCPDEDKKSFEDIKLHKFFNTNNLWVNLDMLKATLDANNGVLKLPLIKNKKTVNPRDSSTTKVFQLETAMGSAIECFDKSDAIVVPRTRFAPVKTCNDLFVLRSDAYKINEDSTVSLAVDKAPLAKLDDKYYKLVDKMESLVASPPSMIKCETLKIVGPVKIGKDVVFEGNCEFINEKPHPVVIPDGSVFKSSEMHFTADEKEPVAVA
eukprot:TRINITY_DN10408_c0_g1_i1.p1 TRINITY_DN10408_c0_g1~~TRINITY_DN10408_c0_g1_i1.p1  ORF type:complete len:476 (+),score=83.55 TRINITY_DN10408_c0_g1_i1:57-1484(+)